MKLKPISWIRQCQCGRSSQNLQAFPPRLELQSANNWPPSCIKITQYSCKEKFEPVVIQVKLRTCVYHLWSFFYNDAVHWKQSVCFSIRKFKGHAKCSDCLLFLMPHERLNQDLLTFFHIPFTMERTQP